MNVEELTGRIRDRFRAEVQVRESRSGVKGATRREIYVSIDRSKFRNFVDFLFEIQDYPHFSVISTSDLGDRIELLYHFTVDYGMPGEEKIISVRIQLPKSSPKIETITDRIPGALISEREIHEMMGVEFIGLKDTRHFFLPEDWPEGKYPWRRDDTFPECMLNRLYETWKEGDENE